jgi:ParB family transcriptional regulator, chromosome partitioning protein
VAKQRVGLGRGLDALISGASTIMTAQQPLGQDAETSPLVDVDSIIPNPHQPRHASHNDDPKLLALSASIKEHGLIQPIIVTRLVDHASPAQESNEWFGTVDTPPLQDSALPADASTKYQIIAGERRWRAARMAGLSKVSVVIKDATPLQMLELALVENIQRADLNPIEEALAYQALIQEFNLTQEQVAKQVGKDRSTITNSLRLLQLAPEVRDALINQSENFAEGHARALISIPREEDQIHAMNQIIAQHLTVRQAEDLATRMKRVENAEQTVQNEQPAAPQRSFEIESLTTDFRNALMVKVDLKYNAKGKGTLVLHFNNQGELEGLYNRLVKSEE